MDMWVPGPLLPVATSARSSTSRTFMPEGRELREDREGVAPALGGPLAGWGGQGGGRGGDVELWGHPGGGGVGRMGSK